MVTLNDLEQKFGFEYPAIYHKLDEAGMLDWFRGWNEPWTAGRNWYTEIYPTLVDNPPLLLHNHDFEIYQFKDILENLETIPDYWDKQHLLVPIGMNGASDWYAFYFTGKTDEGVPIVFAPHDEMNATYLAKNMEDFIFRMMLEYVANLDKDYELEKGEDVFIKDILLMLKSHQPYLLPTHYAILNEVYKRPVMEQEYGLGLRNPYKRQGLLGEMELNELITQNIGFDKLDTEFQFML